MRDFSLNIMQSTKHIAQNIEYKTQRKMNHMISVILAKKILSLFIIMLLGIGLVKRNVITVEGSKSISLVMLYLMIPCSIINSFQVDYTDEIRDGLLLAFAASVILHVAMILLTWILERFIKLEAVEKASVIYSNAGNLIIPIVTSVLGPEWVIYSSGFISVQLFLLWSHGKMLLGGEKGFDARKVFSNINMIAVFVGIIMFFTKLRLPAIVQDSVSSVASMLGPSAMLVTGILLSEVDWKKVLGYSGLWKTVFLRLIVYPMMGVLLLKGLGMPEMVENGETILLVTLLANMTPPASTVTQMSQIYGKNADYASAINVVCTLLCIVTMPLMVMLYQM